MSNLAHLSSRSQEQEINRGGLKNNLKKLDDKNLIILKLISKFDGISIQETGKKISLSDSAISSRLIDLRRRLLIKRKQVLQSQRGAKTWRHSLAIGLTLEDIEAAINEKRLDEESLIDELDRKVFGIVPLPKTAEKLTGKPEQESSPVNSNSEQFLAEHNLEQTTVESQNNVAMELESNQSLTEEETNNVDQDYFNSSIQPTLSSTHNSTLKEMVKGFDKLMSFLSNEQNATIRNCL